MRWVRIVELVEFGDRVGWTGPELRFGIELDGIQIPDLRRVDQDRGPHLDRRRHQRPGGFNFDGYGNGKLTVTVPEGWKVVVTCTNRQSLPHSCAIVSGPSSTTPAFLGASTPDPTTGLPQGQSATFSFTPNQTGTYRIACLVPGHEDAGMWDTLVVAWGSSPSISTS